MGSLTVHGILTKLSGVSVALTTAGNVVNDGLIYLNADSSWLIRFTGYTEAQYVGGGDVVLASDVGLWVTGSGRLNLVGASKLAWCRALSSISAGATSFNVGQVPTGWQVGDEIAIVPTGSPATDSDWWERYDIRTISAISGSTITVSSPLTFAHPSVQVRPGVFYAAEILNLTRTGRIEGQDVTHRAHVWIMNSAPVSHNLSSVQIRYMGPQHFYASSGNLIETLGRYPLHFHRNQDFTNGTTITGVVVRDFGAHAFVSHDSNGITYQSDIAHDGFADPYWWDNRDSGCTNCTEPVGISYLDSVASKVHFVPEYRGFVMTGFFIGARDGNVARGNVAVGVGGDVTSSGFMWPEGSHGTWVFDQRNVSHNNRINGIYAWQNDARAHVISDFVAYYNGKSGLEHGAYLNSYQWIDVTLFGNGADYPGTDLILHAMSDSATLTVPLRFIRLYIDAQGRPYAVETVLHSADPGGPMYFQSSTFLNYTTAGIHLAEATGSSISWIDVDAASTFSGNRYWMDSTIPAGDLLIDHSSCLTLRRIDQPGTLAPLWNARTTPLSPC